MTTADAARLDAQLRRREGYVRTGHNPPPAMHLNEIAKRFGISHEDVKRRLIELFPSSKDA